MSIHHLVRGVVQTIYFRLDQINRTGRLTLRRRINEDSDIGAIHHRVSEIVTPNPEVDHANSLGQRSAHESGGDFAAKRIITEENISDAGDEDVLHRFNDKIRITNFEDNTKAGMI